MNILFDLDGTIIDPFVGIANSLKKTLANVEVEIPTDYELRACIGRLCDRILPGY